MFRARLGSLVLAQAVIVGFASVVTAQEPPVRRPARQVFGATPQPDQTQGLDWTASLFGAYDDNVIADQPTHNDRRFQVSGTYTGANMQLSHFRRGRLTTAAHAQSSARYYPDLRTLNSVSHGAGFSIQSSVGSRFTWSSAQNVSYAPYFALYLFNSPLSEQNVGLPDPQADLVVSDRRSISAQVLTQASYRLTSRTTLTANYDFGRREFLQEDTFARQQRIAGGLEYRLSQYVTVNAGYGRREFLFRSGAPSEVHDILLGANYSRPLSFSRRTTLMFSTGSSGMSSAGSSGTTNRAGTRFRVNGAVSLNHQIGRTWTATGTYGRGVRLLDGLDQITYADTVSASVGGYLHRRIEWTNMAAYSTGQVGLELQRRPRYDTYMFTSQVRFALSTHLAWYSQYLYYYYDFDRDVPLQRGVGHGLDRHGVRVGLSAWLPLMR